MLEAGHAASPCGDRRAQAACYGRGVTDHPPTWRDFLTLDDAALLAQCDFDQSGHALLTVAAHPLRDGAARDAEAFGGPYV